MPHYDRHGGVNESTIGVNDSVLADDEDAMEEAAQALREVEVEAVQPNKQVPDEKRLESMSIDELRALAAKLGVPNRGAITEQDQLIAAIRQRM